MPRSASSDKKLSGRWTAQTFFLIYQFQIRADDVFECRSPVEESLMEGRSRTLKGF